MDTSTLHSRRSKHQKRGIVRLTQLPRSGAECYGTQFGCKCSFPICIAVLMFLAFSFRFPFTARILPSSTTLLCAYNDSWGGLSEIFLKPLSGTGGGLNLLDPWAATWWQDERSIRINGVETNFMWCSVTLPRMASPVSCTPVMPERLWAIGPTGCNFCPCSAKFELSSTKHFTDPVLNKMHQSYIVEMCRVIVKNHDCRFATAVLVGFGIGSLPTCLTHSCPLLKLVIVDVDPGAEWVGEHFFGWQHEAEVVVEDASKYIGKQKSNKLDLVVVDCFEGHFVPTACSNEQFFVDIKRVLKPMGSMFAMNIDSSPLLRKQILQTISWPHTQDSTAGQWQLLWNPD